MQMELTNRAAMLDKKKYFFVGQGLLPTTAVNFLADNYVICEKETDQI